MELRWLTPALFALCLNGCVAKPAAWVDDQWHTFVGDKSQGQMVQATAAPISTVQPAIAWANSPIAAPLPGTRMRQIDVPPSAPMMVPGGPANTSHNPEDAITAARISSVATANNATFYNATQIYEYWPGIPYQILTAPDHVTLVALRPDEEPAPDPFPGGKFAGWSFGKTRQGTGPTSQWIIVLRPGPFARSTNAALITTKRTYLLDLVVMPLPDEQKTTKKGGVPAEPIYNFAVAWNYPEEEHAAILQMVGMEERKVEEQPLRLNPSDLDFQYRIEVTGGSPPAWMPRAVFTDGQRTWITFPMAVDTASELPALLFIEDNGEGSPKTYTPIKDRFVIPGILRRAQLRVGKDSGTVVTITRTGA